MGQTERSTSENKLKLVSICYTKSHAVLRMPMKALVDREFLGIWERSLEKGTVDMTE
jgi:hypothetical protein